MGGLTYAIGDIHGRLDLMLEAIGLIHAHGKGQHRQIVMLGDYVDRGPDSQGVVEYLIANAARQRIVCLKGNHEAMMVDAIRGGDLAAMSRWMFHGGEETMRSYGWNGRHAASAALVPPEHLDWMAHLAVTFRDEERIFVHAGLDPAVDFDKQSEAVCLWIREGFLGCDLDVVGRHIVHGHTPEWSGKPLASEVEISSQRTNLDTGAYMTGVLAIGVFESGRPGGPLDVLSVVSGSAGAGRVAPRWRQPQSLNGLPSDPSD